MTRFLIAYNQDFIGGKITKGIVSTINKNSRHKIVF